MKIEFEAAGATAGAGDAEVVLAFEGPELSSEAQAVDAQLSGQVSRALAVGRFAGKADQTLTLPAPVGSEADSLVLVGAGRTPLAGLAAERAGAAAYRAVMNCGSRALVLRVGDPAVAASAALGVQLAAYRFDRYRTTEKPETKPSITAARISTADPDSAAKAYKALAELGEAIILARDLVSEPANILYPGEFARRVKGLASLGLEVEVLGVEEMTRLGMGALLGVGQGSARESQLALIQWKGANDPAEPPVAFVGKGVCFDTGGVSLKPWEKMEEMVTDMGGAAAVAGTMQALAARKAKINAVGVLALVENMPDGNAQRPGDVVRTMSGQTVEVINTDAEGRLILADALWYCQDRFKPRFMVDLATLTGAVTTALGSDVAGLFSNDDALCEHLLAAAMSSGDPLWRLPLPPQYDKAMESRLADMKNVGDRTAGAIMGALFIQRFVNGLPWAHLDIASTVWKQRSSVPTIPNGATGYGVRLLDQLSRFYEPS